MLSFVKTLQKVRGERGITILEVMVVISVIGILAATLTPLITSYMEDAKIERTNFDVKNVGTAIVRLSGDVAHFPLYKNGTQTTGVEDYDILRGPGNDPVDHDTNKWLTTLKIGELEDHLVKNNPGGTKYASSGRFLWRGPYLEKITEDAWGNRYLVNIKNANPADSQPKVVYVISAGPDGKLQTNKDSAWDSGPVALGDDIVARIK